ncbi:MAG: hypothetical protein KGD65_12325 [Candidatus Lokiarchaeota archaeon]|nr:hypothetical protein [Candidatus Lokiarchaeota archaeon]
MIKLKRNPKIITMTPGIMEWVINNLWLFSEVYLEKKISKSQINANIKIRKNSKKVNLKK